MPARRAPANCTVAVTAAPAAHAAMSVPGVGSNRIAAITVATNGATAIPMSVTLTRRTSPRACAIDISKLE